MERLSNRIFFHFSLISSLLISLFLLLSLRMAPSKIAVSIECTGHSALLCNLAHFRRGNSGLALSNGCSPKKLLLLFLLPFQKAFVNRAFPLPFSSTSISDLFVSLPLSWHRHCSPSTREPICCLVYSIVLLCMQTRDPGECPNDPP
ncbi:unnamed protein product [Protopolystoma xenopodis]|uniref:Uncharacterized protein n=1 Tax=Protopolystoma xenopodis TaxID=117903 RepID=A0A3S5CHG2_9PLAT|nr:unnamed protein product [Protopolystoma xenopodis]